MGCRLMVGQEILVLFIMVRIRAPQPKIKSSLWRFYFWAWVNRFGHTTKLFGSTMSRFEKQRVFKPSRMPRRAMPEGIKCAPTKNLTARMAVLFFNQLWHPIKSFGSKICIQKQSHKQIKYTTNKISKYLHTEVFPL